IARRRLGAVDLLEHVGRQAADAVEFFHGVMAHRPFGRLFLSWLGACVVNCAVRNRRIALRWAYFAGSLAVNSAAGLAALGFFACFAAATSFLAGGVADFGAVPARSSCCWRRVVSSAWARLTSSSVSGMASRRCGMAVTAGYS